MSLFRRSCRSLLSQSLRQPNLGDSRRIAVRGIKVSRTEDEQTISDLLGDGQNTKASKSLGGIYDELQGALSSGLDTTSESRGDDAADPNDQPPQAPDSDATRKSEQRRKTSPKGKDKKSPFGILGLHHLHAQCSSNNTILTFTDIHGHPIYRVTGGMCGFKHVQRSTYEAGYQCAVRMFERIAGEQEKVGTIRLEILFKGRGMGREALQKALLMSEGDVVRRLVVQMTDKTPIKIGGTRAKKARRL